MAGKSDRKNIVVPPGGRDFDWGVDHGPPTPSARERFTDHFDLEPVVYDTCRADDEHLAAHPEERAADIVAAFEDPDVGATVRAVRSGRDSRLRRRLRPHRPPRPRARRGTARVDAGERTIEFRARGDRATGP